MNAGKEKGKTKETKQAKETKEKKRTNKAKEVKETKEKKQTKEAKKPRKLAAGVEDGSPNLFASDWGRLLLQWYDTHKRALPWRTESPRDPYKVWISEIMLQQTRVEAVKSYYQNWMTRFPDIASLAAAEQEDVVKQWQGLGYYNRARNLHLAAQEIVASYGGRMPDTPESVRALKGIGDYTAGAILSMAYGKRETAVDGNVLRVLARLYNLDGNILSATVKKEVTTLVAACQDPKRPGDFNEALMDLGAMICIPGKPRCSDCPLAECCGAKAAGREEALPVRLRKKTVPVEEITVYVVRAEGGALHLPAGPDVSPDMLLRSVSCSEQAADLHPGGIPDSEPCFLLHRRPAKGLLANMWEFPGAAGPDGKRKLEEVLTGLGVTVHCLPSPLMRIKHVFSHRIWKMEVYQTAGIKENSAHPVRYGRGGDDLPPDWRWVPLSQMQDYLLAGPHNKIFTDFLLTQICNI